MRKASSADLGGVPSLSQSSQHRLLLVVFSGSLFLSALLLFSVQPMFAKMVLPVLGGAPAVWAVAMVFFQTALLLGYAYAHGLTRWCPIQYAPAVHVSLMLLAGLFLPLTLAVGWTEPPAEGIHLWVFALFAVSIGLPFVALSANGPLLQAWFSATDHPHASDPYFLYGASNIGSLLALLCYPLILEPLLAVRQQTGLWASGYWVLLLCVGGCGLLAVLAWRSARDGALSATGSVAANRKAKSVVTWLDRATWVGLAAVPSALLIGVTNYITTDIAAVPLLWVVPLALFLLTFIIVFQREPIIPHWLMLKLQPFVACALLLSFFLPLGQLWLVFAGVHLVGFFILSMVCHGELVARRPHASDLTQFYLFMSLGGMLGGLFVGLIAPHIFSVTHEYPLAVFAALLAGRQVWVTPFASRKVELGLFAAALCAVLVFPHVSSFVPGAHGMVWAACLGISMFLMLILREDMVRVAMLFGVAALIVGTLSKQALQSQYFRGFYGVNRVTDVKSGKFRMLGHGTTLHGVQMLKDPGEAARGKPKALAYYHDKSGFADAVHAVRAHSSAANVGIVGLGAGSLVCRREEGETWSFFEIDPLVKMIALDPKLFTFVSKCNPGGRVVVGDARLTLAKEPPKGFNLLVIDAFTSDVVPAHLLTLEALRIYMSTIKDDGVLLMHISNRYADLEPVVSAAVRELGLKALRTSGGAINRENWDLKGDVVAISRHDAALASLAAMDRWTPLRPGIATAWTDDFSNVLGAIWAGKIKDGDR